jgi:hypothetical protein
MSTLTEEMSSDNEGQEKQEEFAESESLKESDSVVPLARFGIECVLAITLIETGWYLAVLLGRFPGPINTTLMASAAVFLFSFFGLVYYGTSYVISPARLFGRPFAIFRVMVEKEALQAKPPTNSREQSPDVAERVDVRVSPESISKQSASIETLLRRTASSAGQLADRMERRTNSYLILGVGVGIVGLAVWYFGFSHVEINSGWDLVRHAIPRLTILVFVELMAGYFLQQYRVGVEDFKYFLNLKREAEYARVAYRIFKDADDGKGLAKLATLFTSWNSFDTRIKKGETTTAIETLKSQENITLAALKMISDQLPQVVKAAKKDS